MFLVFNDYYMKFVKSLRQIRQNIGEDVKLVSVTKNRSVREINQLLYLGVEEIGESRVQEALRKKSLVKYDAKWHMIGHLQRNKVKDAVKIFDMIQSLDSWKLAKKIDRESKSQGKIMGVLVQINISGEKKKHGLRKTELITFLRKISSLKNIQVLGLMAMAPHIDAEKTRPYFREMKELFDLAKEENIPGIKMKYLSMGMSNDYRVAVEEGANIVRIGRAIFGKF